MLFFFFFSHSQQTTHIVDVVINITINRKKRLHRPLRWLRQQKHALVCTALNPFIQIDSEVEDWITKWSSLLVGFFLWFLHQIPKNTKYQKSAVIYRCAPFFEDLPLCF